MIRWPEIAPLLIDVIGKLAADPRVPTERFSAEWTEGKRGAIDDKQRFSVLLKLTSVVGIGWDEQRLEEVADDATAKGDLPFRGKLRATIVGQRKFTLQIQVHSVERTDDMMAMVPLDRIRIGLVRESVNDRLLDADVSVIDIKQSIKANYKDGGRVVSAASMDVVFGTSFGDTDPVPIGWVAQIVYDSHVRDVDGTEPASLNVTGKLTPDPAPAP